ncbi:MAG: tetratricopeptide repeat protein [Flavipsychrobacter sp.]|nr:tetratricopeptide repeat protein [Flavipsychrobacter sp.]
MRLLLYIWIAFCLPSMAVAQSGWPSPEVEQMYNTARGYLTNGKLQQAIVTYRQAIQLAPGQMVLHRDLGRAYYLSGNSQQAEEILEPILKSGEADEQTYQVMASIEGGNGDKKKARATLQKGLVAYPQSGILHHQLGVMYEEQDEPEQALTAWLNGMQRDPAYHLNYYEAARMYMNTDKPLWAILYGEVFVNLEQFTPRSQETRAMLLAAYKKIFYTVPSGDLPRYSKNARVETITSFEAAATATLTRLSPVVSDGVNTENLIMLRTRFIMDWMANNAARYPHSLFSFHDRMLREGYFDAYNQWLFAKADNPAEFEAWQKFHEKAMPAFNSWLQQNKYKPSSSDFYNEKLVKGLFDQKKNNKR